jgi:hypothetical protein
VRFFRRVEPDPPQRVWAHLDDGTAVACRVVFTGVKRGIFVWEIVNPLPIEHVVRVSIGTLPAKTAVGTGRHHHDPSASFLCDRM